jgi:hypothetical protein
MERTHVEDFSDVGCRFRTQTSLRRGDTIAIRPLGPHDESLPHEHSKLFEIMWVVRRTTGWTVGARTCQIEKDSDLESASPNDSPRIP